MNAECLQLLIVEDEAAHVEAIRRAFEKAATKVEIHAVSTLREYRECVAVRPPDLALVDLKLPDGRAVEILTHPAESGPFPILVMTAFGNQSVVLEVIKAGALDYVVKSPEAFSRLPQVVERACREWDLLQKQKRTEDIIRARARLLEFSITRSLDELLVATLDEAEMLTGSRVGFYHFLQADQKTLSLQAWSTRTTKEMCTAEVQGRHYNVSDAGVWVEAIHQRQAVIHNDYATLPNRKGLPPGHAPVVRELVVPVLRGDLIVAVLGVGNKPVNYTAADVEVVTRLADQAWDFAERKRAAEELVIAKEEWERTFDAIPDLISIIDVEHRIRRVNRAMANRLGVTSSQAVGLRCFECVHGLPAAPDFCPHAKLIIDHQEHTAEVHEDRLGGDFLVTCAPLRDSAGRLIGSAHVAHDITIRKRVETELQESNRQLAAALNELRLTQRRIIEQESLREMGLMASGIAHDFNNALAPIIGFSELLLQHPAQLANTEKVAEYLRIINTCGQDAAGMVRRLREFGRKHPEGEVVTAIDLVALVRQAIALTQPRWKDQAQSEGRTIQMVAELQPVPPLTGEAFAIRELLTNLIFNAVDALPKGGTITLSTVLEGRFACLQVRDNGVGMTEEVRRHCLEPFFSTKGANGVGLGLAMAHGIVQRHGGTLEIASEAGQGTTITVRLPVQTPAEVPAPAPAPASRSLRVLVVDDEPLVREITVAYLTNDGHTVTDVSDGATALAQLRKRQFDVVLTDKAMPVMSGEQLAAAIAREVPGLPVIMMTGFGDMLKAADVMPPDIRLLLSKPVTPAALRAALATVVTGNAGDIQE